MQPSDATTSIGFHPLTVDHAIRPEETDGQTVGGLLAEMLAQAGLEPRDRDVLVISSKIASFYEPGAVVRLADVTPSRKARVLGWVFRRDPRKIQLVLEEGRVMLVIPMKQIAGIPSIDRMLERRTPNPAAMRRGYAQANNYVFVVHNHATYLDEAGIDHTNSPDEFVALLPLDPCATARRIREEFADRYGVDVAVIVSDTVSCIGRLGSQDVAIGYAGIDPITRDTFSDDLFGIPRSGGIDLVIDSITGMAGLIMGQTTERRPAVLIRGLDYAEQREDESPGMTAVAMPREATGRIVLHTLLATAAFRIANLFTFQRDPRRPVVRR
jgi:coenzyme F420-0:L-glutamate ligase/coenzyme F420-1:gamma-L-glutamate ligase